MAEHQKRQPLMPVETALTRLLNGASTLGVEQVPLSEARGRILAEDVAALRTQPPFSASGMDGYAVRSTDVAAAGAALKVITEIPAGQIFDGGLKENQCARIFTGAVMPDGADAVLIQEDATVSDDNTIVASTSVSAGTYVRPAGLDFTVGDILVKQGTVMDAGALSLAASGNHAALPVYRKPIIGILATGDELQPPGSKLAPGQIIASNSYGVAAIAEESGATTVDLGIARDNQRDLQQALQAAREAKCDILVTLGGASVGDHDLVRPTFIEAGMILDFWKIAMQPGKPLMLGTLGDMRVLGLPGNPVSSLVCAHIFLAPLIYALTGREHSHRIQSAVVENAIPANGERQQYVRAVVRQIEGGYSAFVFDKQDSSILSLYAKANALVVRPAGADACACGEKVHFITIGEIL